MASPFNDVVVLRPGDSEGNRMVVRVATHGGTDIHAVAVPQDRLSRTGPTWTYLVREEGLTLIDAVAIGSFSHLADGVRQAGYEIGDIDRVVVTHGHADHDGAVAQLVEESGAALWAHEIYSHLLPYDRWEIQRRKVGRRNVYRVDPDLPLRHHTKQDILVSELLEALAVKDADGLVGASVS